MTKTMLYKHPGPHKIHGNKFDYVVTEDIEAALKDGWFLTTPEALEAGQPKAEPEPKPEPETIKPDPEPETAPEEESELTEEVVEDTQPDPEPEVAKEPEPEKAPTRDQIKKKADELGIEYPKNIKTPRLQKLVEDKLDELDQKTTD